MKYTKFFLLFFYGFFGYLSLIGMEKKQTIAVDIENVFFQLDIVKNEESKYIESSLVYSDDVNSISFLPHIENPSRLLLAGKDNFAKLLNEINTNEYENIIFLELKKYQQKETESQQHWFLRIKLRNPKFLKYFLEKNINSINNSHFNMTQSLGQISQMTKTLIGCSIFAIVSAIVFCMYKYKY